MSTAAENTSAPIPVAEKSTTSTNPSKEKHDGSNGIAAALARSLTRGVAIYFSRPVRLFRPSKVSGWTSLRGSATRDGAALSPSYVLELIRSQGFLIIPRHFIPPLVVNTLLGAVLWESYSYSSTYLETKIPNHPIIVASTAGAIAGACQSIAAAPAENVRIVLENMNAVSHAASDAAKEMMIKPAAEIKHSGWMHAWRQVFQGEEPLARVTTREEVRELSRWTQEIRGMAGRGWDGWSWGCGKDMCGFALFFSIFEFSRKASADIAYLSVSELERLRSAPSDKTRNSTARIVHGVTLVGGGVVAGLGYEMVCRPFDNARRWVHLDDIHQQTEHLKNSAAKPESRPHVVIRVVLEKLKSDGPLGFFVNPQHYVHVPDASASVSKASRWMHTGLRTLARVGPWGIGFLLYEGMGGGLVQV